MLTYFLYASILIALYVTPALAQPSSLVVGCPYGLDYIQKTILHIEYQITIETEVFFNTSIIVNEGVTIEVTNAPTNLSLQTIGTSTSTITRSFRSNPVSSALKIPSTPFRLAVIFDKSQLGKRQPQPGPVQFINGDSGLTSSCTQGISYSLTGGTLYMVNGTVSTPFSASAADISIGFVRFQPNPVIGPYTAYFSLTSAGSLIWTNPNFPNNGAARFCLRDEDSNVYVSFMSTCPSDGSPINLNVVEASNCAVTSPGPAGISGAIGATGPSGPPGPSGAPGPSGPSGPQGAAGVSGAVGATGVSGAMGLSGIIGATGPTGPSGPSGRSGPQGPTGPTGSTGPPGPQGSRGASAYSFMGCFASTSTSPALAATSTMISATSPDTTCSAYCSSGSYSLFGTVNPIAPSVMVTCYCANSLNLVPVAGITSTGTLDESACVSCTSSSGQCGVGHPNYALGAYNSIAVYSVTF